MPISAQIEFARSGHGIPPRIDLYRIGSGAIGRSRTVSSKEFRNAVRGSGVRIREMSSKSMVLQLGRKRLIDTGLPEPTKSKLEGMAKCE